MRIVAIAVVAVALLMPGLSPAPAKAWTASNHRWLYSYYVPQLWEDGFYNYDHNSDRPYSSNVDWAVTVVFTMDADTSSVKYRLWGYAPWWDAEMWNECRDVQGVYEWHKDRGTKTGFWPSDTAMHMRPYAPHNDATGKDQFYNLSWVYYCIGTTHMDHYPFPGYFGYSERCEETVVEHFQNNGYYVWNDYYDFRNNEPYRAEGTHIWYNNSMASEVMIW